MRPPRILAFAYACQPGEGSEAGAGWVQARMLAGLGETWVLTRTVPPDAGAEWPARFGDGEGYQPWLRDLPEKDRLRFVHVEIPWWDRFWFKRPRRPRMMRLQRVEYMIWLWLALRAARRLIRDRRFDAAWHLTWANAWIGSTLPMTGLPFVYGPVGGGVGAPWRLVAGLGGRAFISELGREVVRTGFRYLNPLCRLASRRAALVLAQNPETRDWLPGAPRGRTVVFSNAVTGDIPRREPKPASPPYTALWAGRMLAWKGASLAIRTMALLPDWQLLVAGDGPEEANLHRQVRDMGIQGRVEFLGRITRPDVLQVMRERTDLLLFPSLHDDAGMIVAEAVAMGIPAVCLDRGGPPVLGGVGVKAGSADQTVRDLAEAVRAASIGVAAPNGLSAPLPATLEARRAELAGLVRRFEVFEPEGNSPLKVLAASPAAARMRPGA